MSHYERTHIDKGHPVQTISALHWKSPCEPYVSFYLTKCNISQKDTQCTVIIVCS